MSPASFQQTPPGSFPPIPQNPTRSTVHPLAQEEIYPEAKLFFRIVVTGKLRLPQNQSNETYQHHLSHVNDQILSILHRYALNYYTFLHSSTYVLVSLYILY